MEGGLILLWDENQASLRRSTDSCTLELKWPRSLRSGGRRRRGAADVAFL